MIDNIIGIALLAVCFFLLYLLFEEIKKQKKVKAKYQLDENLNKQILTMLAGDKKAALRLLNSVRKNNPNKSYVWYQEKVIRDLERDRRY
jgi:ABC-type protease/lipase transport system fused ATPase/permease subunit